MPGWRSGWAPALGSANPPFKIKSTSSPSATNSHKLSGLTKPEIQSFTVLKVRNQTVGKAVLPLETLGENLFLLLLASSGCWHSLACGCITLMSAAMVTWSYMIFCVYLNFSASLLQGYL
ncbi:unnamed protein product [Nyctereutes procyonoides]|uniref:(raccoon dog) hypothetical protein n=1 Tax=Nyctereutes procyonoides TaxID=34880 RepID=A0A811YJS4_NYCPR|nr:unnamed protein product [Nyctereutes procyonoides]